MAEKITPRFDIDGHFHAACGCVLGPTGGFRTICPALSLLRNGHAESALHGEGVLRAALTHCREGSAAELTRYADALGSARADIDELQQRLRTTGVPTVETIKIEANLAYPYDNKAREAAIVGATFVRERVLAGEPEEEHVETTEVVFEPGPGEHISDAADAAVRMSEPRQRIILLFNGLRIRVWPGMTPNDVCDEYDLRMRERAEFKEDYKKHHPEHAPPVLDCGVVFNELYPTLGSHHAYYEGFKRCFERMAELGVVISAKETVYPKEAAFRIAFPTTSRREDWRQSVEWEAFGSGWAMSQEAA